MNPDQQGPVNKVAIWEIAINFPFVAQIYDFFFKYLTGAITKPSSKCPFLTFEFLILN
jgi:hypothetical protein